MSRLESRDGFRLTPQLEGNRAQIGLNAETRPRLAVEQLFFEQCEQTLSGELRLALVLEEVAISVDPCVQGGIFFVRAGGGLARR